MKASNQTVLVLDFGSQYSQLIARRIRECNVYSRIVPFRIGVDEVRKENPSGIIFSGGPASVYQKDAPRCDPEIFKLGIPILGICYGLQMTSHLLGGKVSKGTAREYGRAELEVLGKSDLFTGLEEKLTVWMSHGDKVLSLPEGFSPIAKTSNTEYAAVCDPSRKIYGIQFHPEVVHTPRGRKIIENFCLRICGCRGDWTMQSFIDQSLEEIRTKVGKGHVILGLSGGVDSAVAAALIHEAIGRQLTCIFVNNGLLRKDEVEKVALVFRKNFKIDLRVADSEKRFLDKLAGVEDPERKRKIIGHEFVEVFQEAASEIKDADFLAQGTTYPDVIESVPIGGNPSSMIKSHHNVGGLPEKMKMKLVEPLSKLFKDEVREVGRKLGLPEEIVMRQPFPGPGLAVRILGDITKDKLETLREADAIVVEEMKRADLYYKTWQSFAVLLPVKTVGVMGDERTYENVVALRVVDSQDGMTADWVHLPYELLGLISNRIINEVRGVNRVVYDLTSKPPGTIEWE
ncbi:MAG TPA: GMP synthase (glutamine-hydrolyzing) [Lentisphaeria bacterium]|nr:MAG: glutamine-hydrolyzing GMP synthase [Lentisphaerae bacterium GWF2_50_93]HCE43938.1 GMP synthase (glutamine-hydrolyzing) [Lentisphaeria bacterium]